MRFPVALVAAAALALVASPALAQNPAPAPGSGSRGMPAGFAARRVQVELKDITLTPEQQAKVDSIVARYRGQMPAMTRGTPPDSATRLKVRELMHSQDAEIRAVLTPEQQTVWDHNVAELRARRPGGS